MGYGNNDSALGPVRPLYDSAFFLIRRMRAHPFEVRHDLTEPMRWRIFKIRHPRNTGQICISPTRFFVHERVFDAFADRLTSAAEALKVGDPLSLETEIGPLIHNRRLMAVDGLVRDAVKAGATLRTGGNQIGEKGSFYAPTVLTEVPDDARILHEEPFGPVALVQRFSDLEEACNRANATNYGLAAYAFTHSAEAASIITDRVETGIMSINHFGGASPEVPFGGVKDSGYGREGGTHCFDGYLVPKSVSHMTRAA